MEARAHPRSTRGFVATYVVTVLATLAGAGLIATTWHWDRAWLERHVVVPFYFAGAPRWSAALRVVGITVGVGLLVSARWTGVRIAGLARAAAPAAMIAALLASVIAVEATLRIAPARWHDIAYAGYELKVGRPDARYGWVAQPSRSTELALGDGRYLYVVGPDGLRARATDAAPALDRPALVVAGESIATGYGLAWDDTFAARAGAALGLEPVIVAEGGYGVDQAYLRVADLLPRVAHPSAVVTVFVPSQLGRLRRDRPHLALDGAGGLAWRPAELGWMSRVRLLSLLGRVPYVSDAARDRSLALARAVFVETARLARARGATPLFVAVSLGPPRALDAHAEADIIRALFVDTGLPYRLVDVDAGERFRIDGHPNAQGARRIAAAIEAALGQGQGASKGPMSGAPL